MFITNIKDINEKYMFICNRDVATILIQHNIPLLGINKDKYCFMDSEKIKQILSIGGENISE